MVNICELLRLMIEEAKENMFPITQTPQEINWWYIIEVHYYLSVVSEE